MDISKRIRAKREAMGLTATQLAAKVGCAVSFVSMVENGHIPKRTNAGKFAALKRALKVRGGAKPVIRKPRGVPKKVAIETQLSQAIAMIRILTEETRALSSLVESLQANGTALRPLVRPMPPKPPAALGMAILTNSLDKGSIDTDRRYPWKETAKDKGGAA